MSKEPADHSFGILGGMPVKYLTSLGAVTIGHRLRFAHNIKRKKVNSLALSMKQEKFCLEYAKSGNQRQAYLAAGYKCKNDASADASASQLSSNPKVKKRLAIIASCGTFFAKLTKKVWAPHLRHPHINYFKTIDVFTSPQSSSTFLQR